MEQLGLTQLLTVGSPRREAYPYACEQLSTRQQLSKAFYSLTNALLNITEGPNGAVVDISRQSNGFESLKTRMGLAVLGSKDWLQQVGENIINVDKRTWLGGTAHGLILGVGIPTLDTLDFITSPNYAMVVDAPHQEGVFPCVEAQDAASSLCRIGIDGGQITHCDVQRVQINHEDGKISVSLLSPAGGLLAVPAETTCSALGVGPQEVSTQVPVSPTQPAEVLPTSPFEQTPLQTSAGDFECIDQPLIGTASIESVISGFQQACGVTISPDMARAFLDATNTEGTDTLYGSANGDTLQAWLTQQWPIYMGGEHSQTVIEEPVITEVAPITPSDVCNLTDPSPEETIRLDTSSPEKLQQELLGKCGLSLTPEQFDFIARALGLDIWVNDTSADVRLQFIKEMAEVLGVAVLGTPVPFEGVPPTPVVGGQQVAPEGGQGGMSEDSGGFWNINVVDRYRNWINGLPRETRIVVNMLNLVVVSLGLLFGSGIFRLIRKQTRNN